MKYEETGKKVNSGTAKSAYKKMVYQQDSWTTIKFLMFKHKFGLMATWAALMTVLYLFPGVTKEIANLF
jgi:hypothetical protein